jgi:hypothetical protein
MSLSELNPGSTLIDKTIEITNLIDKRGVLANIMSQIQGPDVFNNIKTEAT